MVVAALCIFGGTYYFKYQGVVNTVDSNKKGEIIFGIGNNVLSNNMELDSLVNNAIKKNNLTFDSNKDYDNEINTKLMNSIENDKSFTEIKKLTNKNYSVYNEDGKIGDFYGKYSQGWFSKYCVKFDDKKANGLFISGGYNAVPRKVNKLVSFRIDDNGKYTSIKNGDYNISQLIEIGKKLVGREDGIVISQVYECDMDGDNKIEKIVNYNNAFSDEKKISENYMKMKKEDYEKYYSVIAVLDENNNVIDYIQDMPRFNIDEPGDFVGFGGDLFSSVNYICDIDNDNNMEIITHIPQWEGVKYRLSKLTGDLIFSTDRSFGY